MTFTAWAPVVALLAAPPASAQPRKDTMVRAMTLDPAGSQRTDR
jgi:hypothetical protein